MKEIIKYQCEVCGRVHSDKEDAARCETKPVQNNKGVKVGDVVRITRGSGAGQLAKVTAVPPQRQPLTDEEIRKAKHHMVEGAYHYSFQQGVRYAEAAHGIKGEA